MAETVIAEVDKNGARLKLIEEARLKVATAAVKMEMAKAANSAAKADFDASIQDLLAAIDHRDELPLLDAAEAKPDAWEEFPVADLGLPEGIVKALAEHEPPIINMLDLAAWTKNDPLTSIKGIGEGKAKQIEDAVLRYWAEHPRQGEDAAEGGETEEPAPMGLPDVVTE